MAGSAFLKRLFDVAVASVLLLVTLPMIVICAIGAGISLRCWPFFTQTRIGRGGEEFRFLKLRTLPPSAPRYTSKYELSDIHVPRFCLALRQLHLDELPQLLLVLIGKMSLVGPRPEMAYLYTEFSSETAAQRTSVRPGCTGLWQVSEYSGQMIYEHPEFDTHYVGHRSLRFDLWIILRTIAMHLPGGHKHVVASLDELPAWASPRPEVVESNVICLRRSNDSADDFERSLIAAEA